MIDCAYRGADTGRTIDDPQVCCGLGAQPVYRCEVKGECIPKGAAKGVESCQLCTVPNRPATFPVVKPEAYRPIPFNGRAAQVGAFNCSLHGDDRSGFAFAFRSGWTSSDVRLCRLTEEYRPVGTMLPALVLHPRASRGREDPRLFRFRGQWHFSFTGYEADQHFCSVLYARIGQWPHVEKVFAPHYEHRKNAEKNWVFFDYGGELHAVYQVGPTHRVFRFDGESITAEFSTEWKPQWAWGDMRGGCSPILHNGEWYHWFHGTKAEGGSLTYTMGLYTFENRPPFRPLRMVRSPLAVGGWSHRDDRQGWAKLIYYPCGAALKNGRWHISAGEHDNRCSAVAFDVDAIEKELKPWQS